MEDHKKLLTELANENVRLNERVAELELVRDELIRVVELLMHEYAGYCDTVSNKLVFYVNNTLERAKQQ